MVRTFALLAGFLALAATATAVAADPKPEQLVGSWKLTKSADPPPPGASAVIEFSKDGKMAIKMVIGDQKIDIPGTWKLDGEKLKVTMKGPDNKEKDETMKIIKISDKELVTEDEKGKKDEFEKVPAK